MLISQTDTAGTLYFLPDAQGSTRALVNAAGNITSNYDYDAFGNLLGEPTLETNYLYTGQQYDAVSELYSLRARYYDASIGRFLSRDTWPYDYQNPVELNRYVYTANNPATWSDPSGNSLVGRIALGTVTLSTLLLIDNYAYQQGLSSYSSEYILDWGFGAFTRLIQALLIDKTEIYRRMSSGLAIGTAIAIGVATSLVGAEEDLQFVEEFPLYQETIDDFIETFPQLLDHWKNYIETIPLEQQSWQDFIETFPLMEELWEGFIETIPLEQQTAWDNVLTSSDSRLQYAKSDNAKLIEANPAEIRYSQDTISPRYSDGRTVQETRDALASGEISYDDLPTIRVVRWDDGNLWSLDHRRLWAVRESDVYDTITVILEDINDPAIRKEAWRKLTTYTEGLSIEIKGQ